MKTNRLFARKSLVANRIRVVVNNAQSNYSRIVELEAWGNQQEGDY
jgi:hypothetical protein